MGHSDVREAKRAFQRGGCYLCGKRLAHNMTADYRMVESKEHVEPVALDGPNAWWNILLAHQGCNNEKDDRPPRACELLYLDLSNEAVGFGLDARLVAAERRALRRAGLLNPLEGDLPHERNPFAGGGVEWRRAGPERVLVTSEPEDFESALERELRRFFPEAAAN